MQESHELLELLIFLERGGPVLVAVLAVSILMWTFILERYFFLRFVFPRQAGKIVQAWEARKDRSSWHALRIRAGMITQIGLALERNLRPIKTMTEVLPLLGILGTITGMITIFDVITAFGTGNARGMADGIARALLPTTAGLCTALVGLYFSVHLSHRVSVEKEKAVDRLNVSG